MQAHAAAHSPQARAPPRGSPSVLTGLSGPGRRRQTQGEHRWQARAPGPPRPASPGCPSLCGPLSHTLELAVRAQGAPAPHDSIAALVRAAGPRAPPAGPAARRPRPSAARGTRAGRRPPTLNVSVLPCTAAAPQFRPLTAISCSCAAGGRRTSAAAGSPGTSERRWAGSRRNPHDDPCTRPLAARAHRPLQDPLDHLTAAGSCPPCKCRQHSHARPLPCTACRLTFALYAARRAR